MTDPGGQTATSKSLDGEVSLLVVAGQGGLY